MITSVSQLTQALEPLTLKIANHPLYNAVSSIFDLQLFMEQHVFAVWDFMCLLKELHSRIVSTSAPWFPPKDPLSANLINSILVEEEGDILEDGIHYASHFDIYITAMNKIGSDTKDIQKLMELLRKGNNIAEATALIHLRSATRNFVLSTFGFFTFEAHELAAVFVYGRENITASMFIPLLKKLQQPEFKQHEEKLSTFIYYLKRHIELDNNEHFPKAIKMLDNLINNDVTKLNQAHTAAVKALNARYEFLTDIYQYILSKTNKQLSSINSKITPVV